MKNPNTNQKGTNEIDFSDLLSTETSKTKMTAKQQIRFLIPFAVIGLVANIMNADAAYINDFATYMLIAIIFIVIIVLTRRESAKKEIFPLFVAGIIGVSLCMLSVIMSSITTTIALLVLLSLMSFFVSVALITIHLIIILLAKKQLQLTKAKVTLALGILGALWGAMQAIDNFSDVLFFASLL
jgi:cation transport ATPase